MNGNAFLTANFYVYPKKLFCTQLASIKLNLRIEFTPRNETIYDRLIVHNPLPPSNIYLDHLLNSLRNNLLRSEFQQLTRLHARLHSLCAANFFPGIVGLKYCRYLLKYCFMGNALLWHTVTFCYLIPYRHKSIWIIVELATPNKAKLILI